jgi:cobalt-zinc-cadmium efflux system membrane fusion protein
MKQFGVKTAVAGAGKLDIYLTLPGEAAVNQDTVGHVLPKLGGVVKSVSRNIGDDVRRGDLLVVIESRELASAKADYLAAKERESIALATQEREKMLAEQGVSPEQDYINATNALREIQVQVRAAAQALHALGVSEGQLAKLSASSSDSLTRYEVYAPLSGRVLEKHASIGEVVDTASELFLIADLSTVWINLNVSQKDLPRVQEGQSVRIRFSPSAAADPSSLPPADSGIADATGRIKYIDALLSEDTRTAQARIVLPNPRGLWKPGMFVTGLVTVESAGVSVLVPLEALIKFEGAQTVFVQDSDGFEPRTVVLGRQSATHAEVLSGLEAGETYVVQGAFTVKAELGKSEAGHGH